MDTLLRAAAAIAATGLAAIACFHLARSLFRKVEQGATRVAASALDGMVSEHTIAIAQEMALQMPVKRIPVAPLPEIEVKPMVIDTRNWHAGSTPRYLQWGTGPLSELQPNKTPSVDAFVGRPEPEQTADRKWEADHYRLMAEWRKTQEEIKHKRERELEEM